MNIDNHWVSTTLGGQSMRGYLARPEAAASQPLPTVLIIQEVWGVDEHIQDMANRFATTGYEALAPDLYSWGDPNPALSPERIGAVKTFLDTMPPEGWANREIRNQHIDDLPPDHGQKVRETLSILFAPRDNPLLIRQLKAWVDFASQKRTPVVSVGYCMGGQLSFLLACHDERIKAAVCNYGTAPAEAEMTSISAPVYGFYGETDHRITDAVPTVAETMKRLGKSYRYKIYPGAGHAFFNDTRSSYHVNAARDAWAQTLAFFQKAMVG